jgi:hypothetical protein
MADFTLEKQIWEDDKGVVYDTYATRGDQHWGDPLIINIQGSNTWNIITGVKENEERNLPKITINWEDKDVLDAHRTENDDEYKFFTNKFWHVAGPVDTLEAAKLQLQIIETTSS